MRLPEKDYFERTEEFLNERYYIKRTEEFLDERYAIATAESARLQDMSYYMGALSTIEFLGYNWERNKEGIHILTKNKIKQ